MMNDDERCQCADCGIMFDMYDGFYGNPSLDDEKCSMFTELIGLCRKCAERRGIELDDE